MQSFPKRFDPATHRLRDAIQDGELGRITLARVRHGHFYGLQPDFRERWYVRRALSGGGALLDEGVHAADLLASLFGLPQTVVAQVSHEALGLEVEDLGVAVFRWASGLIGEITSSFTFAAADTSVELYGTQGTLLLSGVDLASRDITGEGFVRRYRSDQAERRWETLDVVPRFKLGGFHQQNAIAFVDALEQGRPPPITVADGLNAGRMIDAAYRSAQSGTSATRLTKMIDACTFVVVVPEPRISMNPPLRFAPISRSRAHASRFSSRDLLRHRRSRSSCSARSGA